MAIKKCTAIFLTFLLLASNIGFAVNVHYCGGEVSSVTPVFMTSQDSACCGMKKEESKSCCKTKTVKAEKEHETVVKAFHFSFEAAFVPSEFSFVAQGRPSVFIEKPVATYYCDANAPPLFKLYSQYVFYA
ncbi:MAG: hypothetical protein EOO50_06445 [Flavobacterium sp.]|uniref:HYC_CC_PP family protein n=1 Tax=Flavobacterium sp. TaxID=239 RepID=UPI00121BC6CA|nr:hypothetical protein [Flavobacterium sp.]RZJ67157.1 MAG: hypothetical protein EOO50_06445 [Flavobacterium sp.]